MKSPPRIAVLSSYEPSFSENGQSRTREALQNALLTRGFQPERHYTLFHHHSDSLVAHRQVVFKALERREIDGLFIGGTPIAWEARQAMRQSGVNIPLVYFGAHPIDGSHEVGKEQMRDRNTVCVRMKLPLTFSHRTFRLLRCLFPALERVNIPFSFGTVFCHTDMALRYAELRARYGSAVWAEGKYIGYKSIENLCWLIDTAYREYPLVDKDGLSMALRNILPRRKGEPVTNLIIAFNDTYHVAGAPERLLAFSRESRVPVIWVNNALMARRGALADFCNPFEDVATQAASYLGDFLEDRWADGRYECVWNEPEIFTLNCITAEELEVPTQGWDRWIHHFHQVIK